MSQLEAGIKFSPQLEAALLEIAPSDDPFNSPDFDPIAFINKQFPTEADLSENGKLDVVLHSLDKRISHISRNITAQVQDHSCQRSKTKVAITEATASIQQLFTKISGIKEKAKESESMVNEITRDIKALDCAKGHLEKSIKALRNLHSLVLCVDDLDERIKTRDYKAVADLFSNIFSYFTLFESFKDVKKIQSLRTQVDARMQEIFTIIRQEFRQVVPIWPSEKDTERKIVARLAAACSVVSVLEPPGLRKRELIEWFIDSQLQQYTQIFAPGAEFGSLDNVDRRAPEWKRKILTYRQTFEAIFPPEWHVPLQMALQFCAITRGHLDKLLLESASSPGGDGTKDKLKQLEIAMRATSQFEKDLEKDFESGMSPRTPSAQHEHELREIMKKYHDRSLHAARRQIEEQKEAADGVAAASAAPVEAPKPRFQRLISDCFTPYMSGYVSLERHRISELNDKNFREEVWTVDDARDNARLSKSDSLLMYIQLSINRCTEVTRGRTFYEITNEYANGINSYLSKLEGRLANKEKEELSASAVRSICLIINTAEYFLQVLGPLEEKLKGEVDPELAEKVDLTPQRENASSLCTLGVKKLVGSIVSVKIARALANMTKMNWAQCEHVGDVSPYVSEIRATFQDYIPTIGRMLSADYFNHLCTELVSSFVPQFINSVYKCRSIGEMAAQQMLLDAHELKTMLLALPIMHIQQAVVPTAEVNYAEDAAVTEERQKQLEAQRLLDLAAAAPGGPRAQKIFKKFVNTEMGRAESLLKVLGGPAERIIITWLALLPGSGVDELVKIFNLRISKKDQKRLVEAHNKQVSAAAAASGQSGSASAAQLIPLKPFLEGGGIGALSAQVSAGLQGFGTEITSVNFGSILRRMDVFKNDT